MVGGESLLAESAPTSPSAARHPATGRALRTEPQADAVLAAMEAAGENQQGFVQRAPAGIVPATSGGRIIPADPATRRAGSV